MKFARGRESIVNKERPSRHVVVTTDVTIAAVDAFVRSDGRWNKCLKELGRYVEK